ncbi:hypothetical protein [Cupriavidus sp. UGS-1]|uniref:hypothetical protein n=1 Tax=Cupriavidus sp. UGS-1 TaxID=2899826 RepID=UPI001E30AEBB|nr:hypothetical protein [Cupriavidus sp. UGS-1]MCD9124015.1 hypothetical protein [Cupriavidus sp. UGS-1]
MTTTVRIELDPESIAVAKPGDVVILRLASDPTPDLVDGFLSSMQDLATRFPEVKFVIVGPAVAEVEVRSACHAATTQKEAV